ncbi:hypothetical protein [Thiocapsa marina]|uniref:hypothetical protein n=1 Tax=Thiocapsa marina TaxID=244573 RepID=UPI000594B6AE|nr:hypothetical protein [Thiocapsa marina]
MAVLTIDGGSGVLNVKGNWTDFGDFIASTGRVRLLAACTGTPVQVTGVTTFCHLDLSTTGIDYLFPADQTITILCSLNLGQGNRLIAVGGGNAFFQLGPAAVITGTADLDRVVIRQPDSPSPVPIPAIGPAGLVTLALLLGGVATWRQYPRSGAAALTDRPKTA